MRDKTKEVEHNARILPKAELVWGWGTQAGQARVRRRIQLITQRANLKKGTRVLEIGCGTGMFTQYLAPTQAELVAIDLSYDFVRQARSKPACSQTGYCVSDIENICFLNDSFDAVVGISILHHLELHSALAQIKRILRNNGRIVFSEPNMLNPQIMLQKNIPFLKKLAGDSPDESAFFRWRLKRFLEKENFCDVRIQPFDFLHPFTPPAAMNAVKRLEAIFERVPLVREMAGSLLISATLRKSSR